MRRSKDTHLIRAGLLGRQPLRGQAANANGTPLPTALPRFLAGPTRRKGGTCYARRPFVGRRLRCLWSRPLASALDAGTLNKRTEKRHRFYSLALTRTLREFLDAYQYDKPNAYRVPSAATGLGQHGQGPFALNCRAHSICYETPTTEPHHAHGSQRGQAFKPTARAIFRGTGLSIPDILFVMDEWQRTV